MPTTDNEEKTEIRELVEGTCDAEVLSEMRSEAGKLVEASEGRNSILAVIGHANTMSQIDDRGFRNRVGVKPEKALTMAEWSVWIFREFQAAQAVAEAATPKPRTSKKRTSRK